MVTRDRPIEGSGKRLLYSVTSYPPAVGGAPMHFHELGRRLGRHHRLRVACHWNAFRNDWLRGTTVCAPAEDLVYDIDGVTVHRMGLPHAQRLRLLPWTVAYYAALTACIDRISSYWATRLEEIGADIDLIHNGRVGREPLSYASLKLARKLDVPFVFTPFHHPRWVGARHRPYLELYAASDALICMSPAERLVLEQLGVDAHKLYLLGTGPIVADSADGNRFRTKYGLEGFADIVLFLGPKYPYKGIDTLLAAAEKVWKVRSDTAFVLIGPRTAFSRFLFARRRDHRIREIGTVSHQDKCDALDAARMLCLPSTQESFGTVFLEAWSYSTPVIGCPIPAVSCIVKHGENGLLAAPEPEGLARAILELLGDERLARSLGEAGKRAVLAHWQWPQLASRLDEIYADVLGSR